MGLTWNFDRDEFLSVIQRDTCHEKPVAYDVVNQYLCAILKIWKKQVDMNANNLTKDQIRSEQVTRLLNSVKTRKKTIARLNFEEKLESEFLPYLLVEKIPIIENKLFTRNSHSRKFCQSALRDRFCFLMTNGGILRGESLLNCELSDLCDLVKTDEGTHQCHILVMQIAVGKTNGLKTLYGRVMRHKDVNLCAIGALSLYLFSIFHFSSELLDFFSNEKWFNVKLLIESSCSDTTISALSVAIQRKYQDLVNACAMISVHLARNSFSEG